MNLNNYFHNIYIINLDKRVDRWVSIENQLQKLNIIEYKRYSAIDGTQLINNFGSPHIEIGNLALSMTTINILKEAKELQLENIFIFEDDAMCERSDFDLDLYMKEVPDNWDMLYFGANHIVKPTRISDNVVKINLAYCAHAFAIHNRMYDTIINGLSKFDKHNDVFFSQLHSRSNSYAIYPNVFTQTPSLSDITNTHVDHRLSMKINNNII